MKFIDSLLNKEYELVRMNAFELSSKISNFYKELGIDISIFNHTSDSPLNVDNNKELYEYGTFAVLKDGDNYRLLDGYRRLLLTTPPDIEITVRVYDKNDLSDNEIISILCYLNQYKAVGTSGGNFFDRGFSLAFYSIYNVNINDIFKSLNGFLFPKKDSTYKNDDSNYTLLKTIINSEYFLNYVYLLNHLRGEVYLDKYFGENLYKFYKENKDLNFDPFKTSKAIREISFMESHKKKYNRAQTTYSKRHVIEEMFLDVSKAILKENGHLSEKTFSDYYLEYLKTADELKNHDNWYMLPTMKSNSKIDKILELMKSKGKVNIGILVEPKSHKNNISREINAMLSEKMFFDTNFKGILKSLNGIRQNLFINFRNRDNENIEVTYSSYGSKVWNEIEIPTEKGYRTVYKCKCFISFNGMSKKDIEKAIKK